MKEKVMDKNKKKIVKKKDIEKIMQKIMRKLSTSASVSFCPALLFIYLTQPFPSLTAFHPIV